MPAVYVVLRRTLWILFVVLVLIALYLNYKIHVTIRKQFNHLPLDSLTHKGKEKARVLDTKKDHSSIYNDGGKTREPHSRTTLFHKLSQLEARLNQTHDQAETRIMFKGPERILEVELPLYKLPFNMRGYKVDVLSNLTENGSDSIPRTSWSGFMCYNQGINTDYPCLDKKIKLKLHQKVSYIPGLDKVLVVPDRFCYTMFATRYISALSSPLSVPCFVLPSNSRSLTELFLRSSDNAPLFLVRPNQGRYYMTSKRSDLTVQRLLQDKGVLHILHHPLLVDNKPVVIKMYVLITSTFPLRVFRHYDGVVLIVTRDMINVQKWTLHHLDAYLGDSFSAHDVSKAWRQVDELIVKSLMIAEFSLLNRHHGKNLYPSFHFFQLLEFHFTFNSSLHPFLIEVKSTTHGNALPDVASDTVRLLLSATSSRDHVFTMLNQLNKIVGVEGSYCSQEHKICLSENELVYVIENHRQTAALGEFKKLYPVFEGLVYDLLLNELQSSDDNSFDDPRKIHKVRSTSRLHNALTLMEYYREQSIGSEGLVQYIDQRKGSYWETEYEDFPDRIQAESTNAFRRNRPKCEKDSNVYPVLTAIYIESTTPEFARAFIPNRKEFDITLPFHVAVVKIWGNTSTCNSEARVNSRTGASGPANYSVGVGWNKFAIHLVDTSLGHPSVISTYNINIHRRGRTKQEELFNISWAHQICSVKQDCDLKTFPGKNCGPQSVSQKSIKEFLLSRAGLPWCQSGDAPGSWILLCANCTDSSSCLWHKSRWTPDSCKHKTLSNKDAKTCLANKKILFIGDSTNRGIMYYLMEKINGSLRQWEKTHSMKIYSSALNDGRTSVSFAYYPQFWLPLERKPDFLKALQHLMARFMPLENSTNTIVVVGGVQWLLPRHVMAIKTTLGSLGLGGIMVIVKTLGSGFHLPVSGFLKLNLEGQQKVAQRNEMVIRAAKTAGFQVVDTYAMTVSRYKEFLMGKCGCHFHKVVDLRSPEREYDEIPSKRVEKSDGLPRFHVIGPVNSAYSEIIISRMCS